MKRCPRCHQLLLHGADGLTCPSCGFEAYDRVQPVPDGALSSQGWPRLGGLAPLRMLPHQRRNEEVA